MQELARFERGAGEPVSPRRVLVVCTANQCRSPMAEGLIRARLAAESRSAAVAVGSAGTWARPDRPATGKAVETLAERGIDIADHRSREISAELLAQADLVLVMTRGHQEAILAEFPSAADRLRGFSSLAGGSWDVADPVGQPLAAYQATARELERLIDAGWRTILGEAEAPDER